HRGGPELGVAARRRPRRDLLRLQRDRRGAQPHRAVPRHLPGVQALDQNARAIHLLSRGLDEAPDAASPAHRHAAGRVNPSGDPGPSVGTLEDVQRPELHTWTEEASRAPGWRYRPWIAAWPPRRLGRDLSRVLIKPGSSGEGRRGAGMAARWVRVSTAQHYFRSAVSMDQDPPPARFRFGRPPGHVNVPTPTVLPLGQGPLESNDSENIGPARSPTGPGAGTVGREHPASQGASDADDVLGGTPKRRRPDRRRAH